MSSNKKTLIDGDFQVGSNHLVVDTVNNYVGFDNATPQNKIDVQIGARTGTHSTGKPLYVTGVTSTSGAEFVSDDGTAGIGIGSSNIFTKGTNQNITIAPDGTGAVGIKTATPNPSGETFDLWVQGDTKITGNVTVGTIIGDGSGLTNIISSQWDSSSEDIYFLNNSGSGSGRVAIGTSTPVSLLTLEGSSGGAPPTTGQEGTSNALVRVRDDNNVTLDIGTSSGTSWLQSSDATAMGTNYAISINPNGGNVGVGTISPNVPLEVNKSAGGEIVRLTTSTGTLYAGADADPPWFGTSSDDHLRLMTNGTEKVRIESGGNVGIGISSPGFSLDVDGDINFTGNLYEGGSLFVNTPWTIETSPDALNYTAGNVGIGTTTAAYTLDVDGDINFTGDLYENGSLFVNTPWNIETSPDALNYTAGNVGIGGVNPSATLEVTGNTHISSNLSVGGTLTLNTITAAALHSLQAVTDVGNVTSNTVQFTNPTTGLVVDSNIVVAGNVTAAFLHGDASNVTAVPSAQITGTLAVANGGTGTTTSTGTGSVVLSDAPTFTGDVTFDTNTLFVDSVNDRVGVGRVSPTATLDIYKEDTTAAGQTVLSSITGVFSGSDATGGNINNTGLYIDLDSSATGGTATNTEEHRVWGIDVDIDVTGDSDDIRGGRFLVRSELAANGSDQNTNIWGIDAQGQHNGSAPNTNIIGVNARSFKGSDSTGLTTNMIGVAAEYELNTGTCTDAYGVRARFDRNGGAVTNSYLFYGDHIGSTTTITNNYGLYVTGADKHYLEGDVGIGTNNPVGVNGGQRLEGSSTTGFEYIATRDSNLSDNDFIGGYLFKNADIGGTEPHYAGMTAYAAGANGQMDLRFFGGRETYEDTPTEPHMTLDQNGRLGIGTTNPGTALDVLGTIRVQTGTNDAAGGEFSIDTNVGHIRRKVGGNGVSLTSYDDFQFYVNATGGSAEGGTQAMIIDNSGNVGIGTTSPQQNLHVHEAGSGQVVIAVTNDTTGSGNNDGIHFGIDNAENGFVWHKPNKQLKFATDNTERMRVDSGTTVAVAGGTAGKGVSFAHAGIAIDRVWSNYPSITVMNQNSTGDTNQSQLRVHGCNVSYSSYPSTSGSDFGCSIYIDGTYQTSSDRRFKTNITTIDNALDKVMSLSGKRYQLLNSDGSIRTAVSTNDYKYGFIAQDLEALGLDETFTHYTEEDDGTEGYNKAYSVDYDSFIPLLVNAIKEQNVIINTMRDQLENERSRNDALEARISALENAS
jgi:hypothetical protein